MMMMIIIIMIVLDEMRWISWETFSVNTNGQLDSNKGSEFAQVGVWEDEGRWMERVVLAVIIKWVFLVEGGRMEGGFLWNGRRKVDGKAFMSITRSSENSGGLLGRWERYSSVWGLGTIEGVWLRVELESSGKLEITGG